MNKELLSYLPLEHLSEVYGIIYSNCTKIRAAAIKGALDKINLDPNLIDEVFMGNVVQAGVDKLLQGKLHYTLVYLILLLVPP
jgi:hypothetical protein